MSDIIWTKTIDGLPPIEIPVLIKYKGTLRVGVLLWDDPSYEDTYNPYRYWDDAYEDGADWEWDDVTHWAPMIELPE